MPLNTVHAHAIVQDPSQRVRLQLQRPVTTVSLRVLRINS